MLAIIFTIAVQPISRRTGFVWSRGLDEPVTERVLRDACKHAPIDQTVFLRKLNLAAWTVCVRRQRQS